MKMGNKSKRDQTNSQLKVHCVVLGIKFESEEKDLHCLNCLYA